MTSMEMIAMKPSPNRLIYGVVATILSISLAGCGGIAPSPAAAGEAPISSRLRVPALMALPDRGTLTIKQLEEGLRQFVNEGQGSVAKRLNMLYIQWKVRAPYGSVSVLEADLNGDGSGEVLTAMNDASSSDGSGTVFIIYRKDGQYAVDRAPTTVLGAGLNAVGDLNRDGRPEIIWSSTSTGANTAYTTLFVASWEPGRLVSLSTGISMAYPKTTVEGGDLLVSGGVMGGYGAGRLQRIRTDRYSWQGEKLTLVDQRYAPSPYSYHRLQDGILAQRWNRSEEAATAYRQAMEPDREAAPTDDTVSPEWRDRFVAAVRTFASFRLDMLLGAPDPNTACKAAISWAEAHPDFLKALNIPRGWANPQWTPANLCGPLPNVKEGEQP